MANIYNIQQSLFSIFDELEENGGELTPELEEQLNITQEQFKSKIKDYSNVIKMLETDITAIKEEKARLSDLQKSKEKNIERLKKIMVEAIENFGDTTKAGGKYVDYGTGKVSVRNSQAIEVEEDSVNRFVNRLITSLKWHNENNQLHNGLVDPNDVIAFANSKTQEEEDDNVEVDLYDTKDTENLAISVDLDIDIPTLLTTEKGINLAKALLDYNIFSIKAKADKKGIKDEAKSEQHFMPVFAKLVTNKSISIK